MAKAANSAFAGEHDAGGLKPGVAAVRIEVRFLEAAAVARYFPNNKPPGHPERFLAGWYWRNLHAKAVSWHGDYTSSRKAYFAAQDYHGKDAG